MRRITILMVAIFTVFFASIPVFAGVEDVTYRDFLSPSQQSLYDQVCEHVKNHDESWFDIKDRIMEDEAREAVYAVFCDYPEYYWLDNRWDIMVRGPIVTKLKLRMIPIADSREYRASEIRFIDNFLGMVGEASKLKTDLEKVDYIHREIIRLCEYKEDCLFNQSVLSVFGLNESVCGGYSGAFKELCNAVDIPCWYISGKAGSRVVVTAYKTNENGCTATISTNIIDNSKMEDHAWNAAIIDGELRFFDVTWDDLGEDSYSDGYFNLTLEEMPENHVISEISKKLVEKVETLETSN